MYTFIINILYASMNAELLTIQVLIWRIKIESILLHFVFVLNKLSLHLPIKILWLKEDMSSEDFFYMTFNGLLLAFPNERIYDDNTKKNSWIVLKKYILKFLRKEWQFEIRIRNLRDVLLHKLYNLFRWLSKFTTNKIGRFMLKITALSVGICLYITLIKRQMFLNVMFLNTV